MANAPKYLPRASFILFDNHVLYVDDHSKCINFRYFGIVRETPSENRKYNYNWPIMNFIDPFRFGSLHACVMDSGFLALGSVT